MDILFFAVSSEWGMLLRSHKTWMDKSTDDASPFKSMWFSLNHKNVVHYIIHGSHFPFMASEFLHAEAIQYDKLHFHKYIHKLHGFIFQQQKSSEDSTSTQSVSAQQEAKKKTKWIRKCSVKTETTTTVKAAAVAVAVATATAAAEAATETTWK